MTLVAVRQMTFSLLVFARKKKRKKNFTEEHILKTGATPARDKKLHLTVTTKKREKKKLPSMTAVHLSRRSTSPTARREARLQASSTVRKLAANITTEESDFQQVLNLGEFSVCFLRLILS